MDNKSYNKNDMNNNMNNKDIILFVITSLDDDDFKTIVDNLDYKDKILFVCDKTSIEGYDKGKISYIISDFQNENKTINDIKNWVKLNQINLKGIIGIDEEYHYSFTKSIADYFTLDYYSKETLDICSNKFLQRLVLKKNKVNVPNFQIIDKNFDVETMALKFPNVIKIITGYASQYMHINHTKDELKLNLKKMEALEEIDSEDPIFQSHRIMFDNKNIEINPRKQFLVEEYIGGNEYSCDFISLKNGSVRLLRVSKKIININQFSFIHGFYLFNPDLTQNSEFKINSLEHVCKQIADSYGIASGVCMLDFKVENGKIVIIEATVRPGISTFMDLMVNIGYKSSFNYALMQKLNLPIKLDIPKTTGLTFYITIHEFEGVLKKFDLSLIEKNKQKLNIIGINKYYNEGDELNGVPDGLLRPEWLGYIMVKDVKLDSLDETMKKILDNILIKIENK